MEPTTSKKKIMLAAILTSGLALAISQSALAQPDQTTQPDQATPNVQTSVQGAQGRTYRHPMNPAVQKAMEKFLNETVAIRKEMAEKHAVMRALLNAGTPDTTKISQLAGELFELREKLRIKAQEAGLPMHKLMMGQDGMGMSCQGMEGRHHKK